MFGTDTSESCVLNSGGIMDHLFLFTSQIIDVKLSFMFTAEALLPAVLITGENM